MIMSRMQFFNSFILSKNNLVITIFRIFNKQLYWNVKIIQLEMKHFFDKKTDLWKVHELGSKGLFTNQS